MSIHRKRHAARRVLNSCVLESLETRQLFSLIGVAATIVPPTAKVLEGGGSYTVVTPPTMSTLGTGSLDITGNVGADIFPTSGYAGGSIRITATINSDGTLVGPGAFTITSGNDGAGTVLLTGSTDPAAIQHGFGFANGGMDFQLKPLAGPLAAQYAGDDLGVVLVIEENGGNFTGNFSVSQDLIIKGSEIGTIPQSGSTPPQVATLPGPSIVIGSGGKLTDSATLSNTGGKPGSVIFQLFSPSNTLVDTETKATTGDGTYTTPTGYVPLTVGTYQWVVTYTDGAITVPGRLGDEPETVTKANPKIVTCASLPCGNIATHAIPQDFALVTGGYHETGNLVFKLTGPGLTGVVDTEIVAINGDGIYVTHSTYVAPTAGTYTWSVSYVGDALNNGAVDQGGPAEQVTIVTGGKITGKKFIDNQGDDCSTTIGTGDDTAYTLAPITIQLLQGSTVVAMTQTDATGAYSFNNLAAGTYTVREVVPAGWILTAQSSGSATVTNSSTSAGNNFADFKLICINGTKYLDKSGNGLSADDCGLAGVSIQLFKNGGSSPVATTTTAADGTYSFSNLGPGSYTVNENVPSGYLQTGPNSGSYTVCATSGNNQSCFDFDNFKLENCQVTCITYLINGCTTTNDISGKLHQGDTVKVTFTIPSPETISFVSYTAPDPFFNANDASQQKIFDVATGVYTKAGTYCLTITVPNCYYQVDLVCGLPINQLGPAGSNIFYTPQGRLHDSDNGGTTPCDCDNPTGTGSIAGNVFNDCNNNGIRDVGETGIGGVKITLTGNTVGGSAVTLYTTTDSYGNYKFSNLKAGVYGVAETQPANYFDGKDALGTLGGVLGNDVLSTIKLGSGMAGTGYTFGELDGASVGGKVYNDKDRDGCIDYGEAGICSVKLVLSGINDLGQSVSYTTYTDANGNYLFDNIRQGTYTLTEVTPTGYQSTKNAAGTEGGVVSADKISCITLEWCDNATGYNFGEVKCY